MGIVCGCLWWFSVATFDSQRVYIVYDCIEKPSLQPDSSEDSNLKVKCLDHVLTRSIQHGNKMTDRVGFTVGGKV